MNFKSSYVSFSDGVRIRKECFGGIVFDKDTGTIIDVDREAYILLSLIQEAGIVDVNDLGKLQLHLNGKRSNTNSVNHIITKLIDVGIFKIMPQGLLGENYYKKLYEMDKHKIRWPSIQDISAPETVHWAVTFKCDANCPDCYIQRHKYQFNADLDTAQALKIIDKIAGAGVFQLAIGGGEPFIRKDIDLIVEKAWKGGLVVHITTGKYHHEDGVLRRISKFVKNIQTGIKHQELIANPEEEKAKLAGLVNNFDELGIDAGANLILSHSSLSEFERIIESLSIAGFKRITLLRYKPPGQISQWMKEKPDKEALLKFEQRIQRTIKLFPHIKFRVDCGLTFLQRSLPSQEALYSGIRGCVAASRIASVAPDGSVFPCSQLVGDKFYAGNLLEDDLKNIWTESKVLKRYRNFRSGKSFKNSECGRCSAKTHCGGCRVLAEDAIGADLGCPDPLPLPSKKSKNRYNEPYDVILDIQESIGFTGGGFPYATYEEIKGWLDEESHRDYPKWLLKTIR